MIGAFSTLLRDVDTYYTARLREHGPTPRGADWNGVAAQEIRFEQLLRVIRPGSARFSLNDFGCGYGALYSYLVRRGMDVHYRGIDVSAAMIETAAKLHEGDHNVSFCHGACATEAADYSVASGIFHVKQDADPGLWREYVLDTIASLRRASRLGFAFNCLTSHSDPDRMRSDLYYANPAEMLDHCMGRYSRQVALLHDYGMFEFTVIVRLPGGSEDSR